MYRSVRLASSLAAALLTAFLSSLRGVQNLSVTSYAVSFLTIVIEFVNKLPARLVDNLFLRLFLSQHVSHQNLPADPGRMRKILVASTEYSDTTAGQLSIDCHFLSRSTSRNAGRDIRTDLRSGVQAAVALVWGSPLGRKGNRAAKHLTI